MIRRRRSIIIINNNNNNNYNKFYYYYNYNNSLIILKIFKKQFLNFKIFKIFLSKTTKNKLVRKYIR